MLIYRGKLVSGPAELPRLMLRELACETVHAGPRVVAGPCVTPIMNGDVARVVELPTGGLRIEWWVKGVGWTEAPPGAFDFGDFVPGDTNRPVLEKDAIRLGCRLEDFGRHWTEERASPRSRAKIVSLIKNPGLGFGLPPDGARPRLVWDRDCSIIE
jgi:hypothetical protein